MSVLRRQGQKLPWSLALSSCRHSTLVARHHVRLIQTNAVDTPLQEAENVHSIVNLAARVRELDSKAIPTTQRLPTRLTSRSWADEAKARASRGANTSGSSMLKLDAELERRLGEPKRMMDSYVELTLPFRTMPELLEKYIATSGDIRLGKVFEDLDNLAGDISYTHVLDGRPGPSDTINPIYIVTASVDRLDLIEPLRADRDYKLSGMVIYVGRSSMEVLVTVEEVPEVQGGVPKICLTGRFTMAARNAITTKSQAIPPLRLSSKAEEDLFAFGQAHKKRKALEAQTSLQKVPPTVGEASLLHSLYLAEQEQESSNNTVKISDTALFNTSHMHPQQRNVHMNVFGGYLIRSSYELAWMNAALYANQPVRFLSLDALSFHLPVSIGTILTLSSHVTYTNNHNNEDESSLSSKSSSVIASVVVVAEINDVATGLRKRSNTFHYSFDLGSKVKKRVAPESYAETLAWIEGKRRVELGQEVRKNYRSR